MTNRTLRVSAIALGAAAFVSLAPLTAASANDDSAASGSTSATSGAMSAAASPTPSGAMPSLSEPAPTPGWAEAGPQPSRHHYAYRPHYIWRNGQEYVWNGRHYVNRYGNPVTTAAAGAVGGVADLGAIAAYPIYCFPYYGSCRVRYPYHGQY